MFTHCRLLCTIKTYSQLLALTAASFFKLSLLLWMTFWKSRYPPIHMALLSQRNRVSSTYSELYTNTMYKSIEKVCCIFQSICYRINIWFYELMKNNAQLKATQLLFQVCPLFNVDLMQCTYDRITHPLMIYVKSTLYSNIKCLCDPGKQISSPWSFHILYLLLIMFFLFLKSFKSEKNLSENWVLKIPAAQV